MKNIKLKVGDTLIFKKKSCAEWLDKITRIEEPNVFGVVIVHCENSITFGPDLEKSYAVYTKGEGIELKGNLFEVQRNGKTIWKKDLVLKKYLICVGDIWSIDDHILNSFIIEATDELEAWRLADERFGKELAKKYPSCCLERIYELAEPVYKLHPWSDITRDLTKLCFGTTDWANKKLSIEDRREQLYGKH